MKQPVVTIVIAACESRPEHLRVALASALSQTRRDIAVVVSDDSRASTLRSLVDDFEDERVRYRHNTPSLGVARNHWTCFREVTSPYAAILNHDDWLEPTFVERLAGVLDTQPEASLAFCDHWVIDERGRRLDALTDAVSAGWGRAGLAAGLHRPFVELVHAQSIPMAAGAMFRRSVLPDQLPDDAGPAYDFWLTYLIGRLRGGAWYVDERLSAWRTHDGNLTSQANPDWLRGAARCWEAMAADASFAGRREASRSNAANAFRSSAFAVRLRGGRVACFADAWRSLRCRPSLKALVACVLPLVPQRVARHMLTRGDARAGA